MTVAALIIVLLGLLGVGAGALVVARRRPGLRRPASAGSDPEDSDASIDPFGVSEPWRQFVQRSLNARDQFRITVGAARRGPLHTQLEDIGESLERGVNRAWATAQQGHRLGQARGRVDSDRLTADLASLPTNEDDAIRGSLQAQLDSARRLDQIILNAEQQLRLLTTQLDEAAARAGELAVRAGAGGALEAVAADITRASDQLEALRLAVEETDRL